MLEAGKEGQSRHTGHQGICCRGLWATKQTATEVYDSTKQQTGELIQGAASGNSTQIVPTGAGAPCHADVTGNAATQEATGPMDQATQTLPKPGY